MSDTACLLIPFASCGDAGCAAARRGLHLPNLEKLLARLSLTASDDADEHALSMPHERVLAREAGIAAADGCIPWAAWHVAQGGGNTRGEAWAWITPCHWEVAQDHIMLSHPQLLELSAADSQALLAAMQPYFEQDGLALQYEAPTLWLARGEVFRDFPSASLDRVTGHVLDRWLPKGPQARTVRRLQQEMQMLLYTHAINDDRIARDLEPVNSFWVSGTGALPSAAASATPARTQVTHYLRDAAMRQDWAAWASAWRQIDERDCAQLLAALDRAEQVALTLCGERNAHTFSGTGGGFFGKLRSALRPSRAAQLLDSL